MDVKLYAKKSKIFVLGQS